MNTIKWINDTFVPWGLKPIEDLPEAVPGQGNSCVIAKVLKDGFPDFLNVQVGSTSIQFNVFNEDKDIHEWIKDAKLAASYYASVKFEKGMKLPQEISDFIRDFDNGLIKGLIDTEMTIAEFGKEEAHDIFKIGCTGNNCILCWEYNDGA